MNKLRTKVFFILLPLAASILGFGYAYYQSREALTIDHIFRSSQLSALLGANEISHYIEGRFTEFDRLSSAMSLCQEPSISWAEVSSNALSFSRGFSALMISDLSGRVQNFHLSSNKSNRYILRQDLRNARVLPAETIELLNGAFEEWQVNY
ncbi:sensor domain-containing diguanylate cyclase, partial [Vibrio sinaloensis]